jgi:hypothetical protein
MWSPELENCGCAVDSKPPGGRLELYVIPRSEKRHGQADDRVLLRRIAVSESRLRLSTSFAWLTYIALLESGTTSTGSILGRSISMPIEVRVNGTSN